MPFGMPYICLIYSIERILVVFSCLTGTVLFALLVVFLSTIDELTRAEREEQMDRIGDNRRQAHAP